MIFFSEKKLNIFCFQYLKLCFLDIDQSLLGVSLTYVLMISGTFQWCIRQSAEVDNLVSTTT